MPLNELHKQNLKVVIVDKGAGDLKISQNNYSSVNTFICNMLFNWIANNRPYFRIKGTF